MIDLAALSKLFTPINTPNPSSGSSYIVNIAVIVVNAMLYTAGIVTVFAIVYGGILYITSAGDATKAAKGRGAAINGLIGLVIVILSFVIIDAVKRVLS